MKKLFCILPSSVWFLMDRVIVILDQDQELALNQQVKIQAQIHLKMPETIL
ncbi:MAG: hypothetical protein R3B93_09190 [Bacteroidia bacterium]